MCDPSYKNLYKLLDDIIPKILVQANKPKKNKLIIYYLNNKEWSRISIHGLIFEITKFYQSLRMYYLGKSTFPKITWVTNKKINLNSCNLKELYKIINIGNTYFSKIINACFKFGNSITSHYNNLTNFNRKYYPHLRKYIVTDKDLINKDENADNADSNNADSNNADSNNADSNNADSNNADSNNADSNNTDSNNADSNNADSNNADDDGDEDENKIDLKEIIKLINPLTKYIDNTEMTLRDLLRNILLDGSIGYVFNNFSKYISIPKSNNKSSEEDKNILLEFYISLIEYIIIKHLNLDEDMFNKKINECILSSISLNWIKSLESLSININNQSESKLNTIEDFFNSYKKIFKNINLNFLFREFIFFLQGTSDYDNLIFNYKDTIVMPISEAKKLLLSLINTYFPKEYLPDDTLEHYNMVVFILNGILSHDDIESYDGKKIKNIIFKNISDIYYKGLILSSIKATLIFLETAKVVENDDNLKEEFMNLLNDSTLAISAKRRNSLEILFRNKNISINDFFKYHYGLEFFVVTDYINSLFTNKNDSYEYFMTTINEIEEREEKKFEYIYVDSILNEDSNKILKNIFNNNQEIYKKFINYDKEYKDIFDWAMESVNAALLASQLGNTLDSPSQFGIYYMQSIINVLKDTNC
jgi:hypothetical protein